MKKILLITYFFPPSNFAGSYRLASFAKYFHKYGYYPMVVTRQAPENAGSFREMAQGCGKDVVFEKHEGYEVHFLPYKANLRDRILAKYGDKKYVYIRRILSFFEMLLQAVTPYVIPYANLYRFSKNYLKSHNDIQLIITSGKPFQLFLFAHLLSKKFKIPWVADYRDEWNSRYPFNDFEIRWREKIYFAFESHLEKKWTRNLAFATTPTQKWAEQISIFLNKPCHVVMNGFDPESYNIIDKSDKTNSEKDVLSVLHLGSLYEWQPVEIFIGAVNSLIKNNFKIKCFFPGVLNEDVNENRIKEAASEFAEHFFIMPRIPHKEVFQLMAEADVYLMVGYRKFNGWMSLKVLEYLPWHKPIILCPGNIFIEEVLKNYSKTFVCNSDSEVITAIKYIKDNLSLFKKPSPADSDFIHTFTRDNQAAVFCSFLDNLKII